VDRGNGKQSRFAIGKRELLRIQQRLIGAVGGHGPLQGFISFQSLVGHASEEGRQGSDLLVNLGRMPVIPSCAQALSDILNDLPVGPATFERLEHLVEPLDAPLCARKGAFLFEARAGGKDHIGKLARLAEEDVLGHKKFQLDSPS
jgi:hypothetical protein